MLGDAFQKLADKGIAAFGLSIALLGALWVYRQGVMNAVLGYWLTVATARTAGTAVGDWLAENKILNIGLPRCTMITGVVWVAVRHRQEAGRRCGPR